MYKCFKCGQENQNDSDFCIQCGTNLTTQKQRVSGGNYDRNLLRVHCTHCGTQGEENFSRDTGDIDKKFSVGWNSIIMMTCNHCGHVELFNRRHSIVS